MFKQPLQERLQFALTGIVGDGVGDRSVHGGPEKALHQFPVEHYDWLGQRYPDGLAQFGPGSVGENFSTRGMDESSVCIGDVFALGAVRLQVSQPRTPCVKLEQRFDIEGLATVIHQAGRAGWYYRVIATGTAQAGDALELIARNPDPISLRQVWELHWNYRPSMAELQRVIASPGLAPQLQLRLQKRADWLQLHAG